MKTSDSFDHPQVIALPPLLLLMCAALGAGLHYFSPLPLFNGSFVRWLGVGLAIAAVVQIIFSRRAMIAVGTNIRPDLPTLAIAREGPYRYTRNPMYLSLFCLQISLGLMLNDFWPLILSVVLILVLHIGVVLREGKYLETKFGETYLGLRREVRRWL